MFKNSARHEAAREWLDTTLSSTKPVALPWVVLSGFIQISTNPRIVSVPLTLDQALGYVDEWLVLPVVRVVGPTSAHQQVFATRRRVANAQAALSAMRALTALATEHGCAASFYYDDFQKLP